MKQEERLLRLFGEISDDLIEEAYSGANKHKYKKPIIFDFKKLSSVAACICLILISIPLLNMALNTKNPDNTVAPGSPTESTVSTDFTYTEQKLNYDNIIYDVYYKVLDIKEIEQFEYSHSETHFTADTLPSIITSDIIGNHISYLIKKDDANYVKTESETNIELFEYALSPCRAVYIIKDNNVYKYALFSGVSKNIVNAPSQIYSIFGINSASDIKSITFIDTDSSEKHIDNSDAIKDFLDASSSLESFYPENTEAEIVEIENSKTTICITLTTGLKYALYYSPEHDYWMSYSHYFKTDDSIESWFDKYVY